MIVAQQSSRRVGDRKMKAVQYAVICVATFLLCSVWPGRASSQQQAADPTGLVGSWDRVDFSSPILTASIDSFRKMVFLDCVVGSMGVIPTIPPFPRVVLTDPTIPFIATPGNSISCT